ncbi:uncharacterized protein TNCV_3607421 [Trichonephila clavipes]|nr:uncharacterized protein TNCV_3607421 [Trichonephila clavipes]
MEGKKLSDKKALDDHGRLAYAEIDKLQRYYGLAIRNNTDTINSMKQAIWATYFHKASIDAYPQHGLCPPKKIPGVNITEQLQQVADNFREIITKKITYATRRNKKTSTTIVNASKNKLDAPFKFQYKNVI